METPRRTFLVRTSAALVASSFVQPIASLAAQKKPAKNEEQEEGVSTNEDLMREHGRPHEAREDTVLFPALHEIVSKHEYDALGEQFEGIERKTFRRRRL